MNILMKNNVLKKLGITLLTIMIPYCVYSQSITVKGTVTDNNNESLIGVTIKEVGTNNGTITDINGNFEIKVSPNASLSFSYIGYKNKTVKVGNQRIINVVMEPDILGLDEVVVVGYGQMKRSDLTGSVVSVGTEAIQKSISTSIDQVLQGRAAGVQVQQTSGMPGASASIRIRGINSLNASTEPIYVIDGVIIEGGASNSTSTNTNPLAAINPADILSVDILKDASATAIYGSRGSNGVILITTRKGKKGEATIGYNGYVGWQQIPTKIDVLNLQEYATHRKNLADLGLISYNNNYVRPDLLGKGTDW
jgi:TonB-linked SusC/RagA family outer membrane protein